MIVRFFMLIFGLFSISAGIREAQRLPVFFVPASDFTRIDGQVLDAKMEIDRTPGHGTNVQTRMQVFAVEFSYVAGNVVRTADSLSPACSYCERGDVVRITGRQPEALKGAKVTVYVRSADHGQAYLELPRTEDMWHRLWMTLLWLVLAPAFAYLFSEGWNKAKLDSQKNSHA